MFLAFNRSSTEENAADPNEEEKLPRVTSMGDTSGSYYKKETHSSHQSSSKQVTRGQISNQEKTSDSAESELS